MIAAWGVWRAQIDARLQACLQEVAKRDGWAVHTPALHPCLEAFLLGGGKRLRPCLALWSYRAAGGEGDILDAAVALELFHHFALIHDDWIDQSTRRRGHPTVHAWLAADGVGRSAHETASLAVLAGDILYALAIECFLRTPVAPHRLQTTLAGLMQTARVTGVGAWIEVSGRERDVGAMPLSSVREMIRRKTAAYTVVAPLVVGASLAGASVEHKDRLAQLGTSLGVAYQMMDDWFDCRTLLSGEEVMTPTAWKELRLMWPVCVALAEETTGGPVAALLSREEPDPEVRTRLGETLEEAGAFVRTQDEIHDALEQVRVSLQALHVDAESTGELQSVLDGVAGAIVQGRC